jgi:hypothetical protein
MNCLSSQIDNDIILIAQIVHLQLGGNFFENLLFPSAVKFMFGLSVIFTKL